MKKELKPKLSKLKKKADELFSRWIRIRDGHKCVLCGSTDRPQCGHVLSRVALATRWDEMNAFCQCAKCNMKHEWNAWPFNSWYIARYGKDTLDNMQFRWNKPFVMTRGMYETLIMELERKIFNATKILEGRTVVE